MNMNKFWDCGWRQMKPKAKKERFHHDYNDKFFTYICFFVCLQCFYLLISSRLKKKTWPTVTTSNTLHAFSPMNPFLQWKIFWHLSPNYGGRGLALGETELSELNLSSINGGKPSCSEKSLLWIGCFGIIEEISFWCSVCIS